MLRSLSFVATALALGFSAGCDRQAGSGAVEASAEVKSARPPRDGPIRNPFPAATELRLFVETAYAEDGTAILSKPAGLRLSRQQRSEFEATLRAHTPAPDEMYAACFIPHHFFRYFDAAGEQIGEIQVCFCCGGVRGNVQVGYTQELAVDYGKLATLISALGEPVEILCE